SLDALTVDAGATVEVVGAKPLLVVAWSTIRIDGEIDAGSHRDPLQLGAGANQACSVASQLGGDGPPIVGGSGGGGGGGQHGTGGIGGSAVTTAGGSGGIPIASSVIRGGCPGGNSGLAGPVAEPPAAQGTYSAGGGGGGAIRLVAHDSIDVAGSI